MKSWIYWGFETGESRKQRFHRRKIGLGGCCTGREVGSSRRIGKWALISLVPVPEMVAREKRRAWEKGETKVLSAFLVILKKVRETTERQLCGEQGTGSKRSPVQGKREKTEGGEPALKLYSYPSVEERGEAPKRCRANGEETQL